MKLILLLNVASYLVPLSAFLLGRINHARTTTISPDNFTCLNYSRLLVDPTDEQTGKDSLNNPSQHVKGNPIENGELSPAMLVDDTRISKFGYRVGLPPQVSGELLNFCDRSGITDCFRILLTQHALDPKDTFITTLGDVEWNIQRPASHWNNNMHWISPAGEEAQEKYLEVLGAGGFDMVLENIGKYFGWEGIVAHHLTFIGVSHAIDSFTHYDFMDTNGKAFNILIPLILANDSGPELGWQSDDRKFYGWYKYDKSEAALNGDGSWHVTADCDYRETNEFRMAATVYVCDVNEKNVDAILREYTQPFPPKDRNLLLKQAGIHWGKGMQLPRPS